MEFSFFWSIKFFPIYPFFLSPLRTRNTRDEHLRLFLGVKNDDAVVSIVLPCFFSPRRVVEIVGWFFATNKRFGDESEKKRDDEEKRIFFCDE